MSFLLLKAPKGPRRWPPIVRTCGPHPLVLPGAGCLGERGQCRTDSGPDAFRPCGLCRGVRVPRLPKRTATPRGFTPQLDVLRPSGARSRRCRVTGGEPEPLWAAGSLGLPWLYLHRCSPCLCLHAAFPVGPLSPLPHVPVTGMQRGSPGSDSEWEMEGGGLSGGP